MAKASQDDLKLMMDLAVQGVVYPVIDRYYNLEQSAEAMRYAELGHVRGKVIIKVSVRK